jgi:hypothetical protein
VTLDELITKLTELRDEEGVDGEALVLFAHQPNYPLQCSIGGPVVSREDDEEISSLESRLEFPVGEYFEDEEEMEYARRELARLKEEAVTIVYLLEGSSSPWHNDRELSPYASRDLWDR